MSAKTIIAPSILAADFARLLAEYRAMERELARFRCGEQVEGDYVCEHALRVSELEREVERLRGVSDEAMCECGHSRGEHRTDCGPECDCGCREFVLAESDIDDAASADSGDEDVDASAGGCRADVMLALALGKRLEDGTIELDLEDVFHVEVSLVVPLSVLRGEAEHAALLAGHHDN